MTDADRRNQIDEDQSADRRNGDARREQHGESDSSEQPQAPARTVTQIVTTAFSVLLIVLLAGAILYEGFSDRGDNPARIEVQVQVEQSEQRGEEWYVPILVRNLGDDTVEELVIAIDVNRDDEVILETDTTIAHLGEASEATATLVLDEDPVTLTIKALPETFQIAEE